MRFLITKITYSCFSGCLPVRELNWKRYHGGLDQEDDENIGTKKIFCFERQKYFVLSKI